jgi:hypothetical protein
MKNTMDYEVVDVTGLQAAVVEATKTLPQLGGGGGAAADVAAPVPADNLRTWTQDFMRTASQSYVQEALGAPDGSATARTKSLLRSLTGGGTPAAATTTVRDQCVRARDAAVAAALVQHLGTFRGTIDTLARAHVAEGADLERVAAQWECRAEGIANRRRVDLTRVMQDLQGRWDRVTTQTGGTAAAANGEANLSDRVLRYMLEAEKGGAPARSIAAAVGLDADRMRLLDDEIGGLIKRSFLESHERDELLSLLRRRTRLVGRASLEPATATLAGGGADEATRATAVETLRVARALEAARSGVDAVQWRLRDTVKTLARECVDAQRALFRSNLDDARQRAIDGLQRDVAAFDGTFDTHLARLTEHENQEALPAAAAAAVGPDTTRVRLAQNLHGVL